MRSQLADLARGAWLNVEGARLLFSDGRLALLTALPAFAGALASIGAFAVARARGEAWLEAVWPRPAPCDGCGLVRAVFAGIEGATWEVALLMGTVLAAAGAGWLVGRGLAAPAMDALAGRAMRRLGVEPDAGAPPFAERPFATTAWAGVVRAVARALAYVAGLVVLLLPALVPGGAAVSAPLTAAWTAAWLFADQVLYPLPWVGAGRMEDVAGLVRARPGLCIGFVLVQATVFAVPFAGVVAGPVGVAGACLLVAECRAGVERRAPDGVAVASRA